MPPTRDAAPDADRIGLSEAARLLGVSADTVRRWGDAGRLTVWRVGAGRYREFSRAEALELRARDDAPVTVQKAVDPPADATGAVSAAS